MRLLYLIITLAVFIIIFALFYHFPKIMLAIALASSLYLGIAAWKAPLIEDENSNINNHNHDRPN